MTVGHQGGTRPWQAFLTLSDGIALTSPHLAEHVVCAAHSYSDVRCGYIVPAGEPTTVALANSWTSINVGDGPRDDDRSPTSRPGPRSRQQLLNIRVAVSKRAYETWSERGRPVPHAANRPRVRNPLLPPLPRRSPTELGQTNRIPSVPGLTRLAIDAGPARSRSHPSARRSLLASRRVRRRPESPVSLTMPLRRRPSWTSSSPGGVVPITLSASSRTVRRGRRSDRSPQGTSMGSVATRSTRADWPRRSRIARLRAWRWRTGSQSSVVPRQLGDSGRPCRHRWDRRRRPRCCGRRRVPRRAPGRTEAAASARRGDARRPARNFHLFQPLTYQVATGALSPGEIAYPLRAIFKRRRTCASLMAEVTGFDLDATQLHARARSRELPAPDRPLRHADRRRRLELLLLRPRRLERATRPRSSRWRARSPFAAACSSAFEAAELGARPRAATRPGSPSSSSAPGPTGVEMAGQIGELARDTLRRDFRAIDPRAGRVLLVEAADRVLTTFPPSLSAKAARSLEKLGVTPLLERTVVGIDARGVDDRGAGRQRRADPARARSIWAAGVTASGARRALAELTGAELDRAGPRDRRARPDASGPPRGVRARRHGPRARQRRRAVALPGVAPVAMQQGRYAAQAGPRTGSRGRSTPPFRYRDKGNLATIGRAARGRRPQGPAAQRLRSPGSPGWSSTSSTWSASRTACWCSSAGGSASQRAAAARTR